MNWNAINYFCKFILLIGILCYLNACIPPELTNNTSNMIPNIPLEDFFRNPEKTAYTLSPNGEYFAFLAPYKNRKNIFVQKVGDKSIKQITKVTDRDLSGFSWANDDRLIYVRDFDGDENFHLFSVTKDGAEEKD
jgi:Tol biopolymer transport system component